ncbi:hypothetical protein HYPSUDRAFT_914355 [Hypholoma sublateritium FD-334 SS-4]|uniref:Uncharacterized protein n=1 Tax=Hypholoma sublateritium (strain FD-334 SS-4) TaxID=945553 RepID=A0A0D2NPZ6_HYPSF|nr:hypothetical protein HYPSUDRAFT_914355 [Hypholoma sublateritium FD-334 SS-4]
MRPRQPPTLDRRNVSTQGTTETFTHYQYGPFLVMRSSPPPAHLSISPPAPCRAFPSPNSTSESAPPNTFNKLPPPSDFISSSQWYRLTPQFKPPLPFSSYQRAPVRLQKFSLICHVYRRLSMDSEPRTPSSASQLLRLALPRHLRMAVPST